MYQMLVEFITNFLGESAGQIGTWAGAAISGAIVFYTNKVITNYKERKKHNRLASLSNLNGIDISVYKYLAELMASTGADRAYVVQFHNGTYYLNQAGQIKMSCTHEMVKEGVSKEQSTFQNLLTSHHPTVISDIINTGFDALAITPRSGNSRYNQMMIERGTKVNIVCALRRNEVLEGYVAIDYITDDDEYIQEAGTINQVIRSYTSKIGFLLRGANN